MSDSHSDEVCPLSSFPVAEGVVSSQASIRSLRLGAGWAAVAGVLSEGMSKLQPTETADSHGAALWAVTGAAVALWAGLSARNELLSRRGENGFRGDETSQKVAKELLPAVSLRHDEYLRGRLERFHETLITRRESTAVDTRQTEYVREVTEGALTSLIRAYNTLEANVSFAAIDKAVLPLDAEERLVLFANRLVKDYEQLAVTRGSHAAQNADDVRESEVYFVGLRMLDELLPLKDGGTQDGVKTGAWREYVVGVHNSPARVLLEANARKVIGRFRANSPVTVYLNGKGYIIPPNRWRQLLNATVCRHSYRRDTLIGA